ncbi:D-alanyl-D-alanine carboxypeptidase/D-alanyl-D-alanine-endopeptidase [Ferruginibacter yonginensis]|uniref:D-alanyl-D-alanine carboxypeptidase/D-alanyl-D-alanine-endopeptidase n=1 Tax=Ferruginibacter yonginensis TaxID=1310416 RepID=A0ABV8QR93_9BACT
MKKCWFITSIFLCQWVMAQTNEKLVASFLNDTAIKTGHVGICIYEPASKQYLIQYNDQKNFTPSSNVKLFTLFAALQYLGDSIPGVQYIETDTSIVLFPTADPTLLHPSFNQQPVLKWLQQSTKKLYLFQSPQIIEPYGVGWAWDDYSDYFMPEKSAMPLYGNVVRFYGDKNNVHYYPSKMVTQFSVADDVNNASYNRAVTRNFYNNEFILTQYIQNKLEEVPFITSYKNTALLLGDTVHQPINIIHDTSKLSNQKIKTFYSVPTVDVLKKMMFESDNFLAEQMLLVISNLRFHQMNTTLLIDSLLKTDFINIPQQPRWVDGSGLSRYNLFTPQQFIYILQKLTDCFGVKKLQQILPTAGEGTLKAYYNGNEQRIFAKTGSMSNNVSLSGTLKTDSGKNLRFSVIINNYSGSGKAGRRAIEKLLQGIIATN